MAVDDITFDLNPWGMASEIPLGTRSAAADILFDSFGAGESFLMEIPLPASGPLFQETIIITAS